MKNRISLSIMVCLAILCCVSLPQSQESEPDGGYELLYGAKRDLWKERGLDRPPLSPAAEEPSGFDVLHYKIDILFDPAPKFISGSVEITYLISATSMDSVIFHLKDNLNVLSVQMDALPVSYLRAGDVIHADLGGPRPAGDTLRITIHYDGNPVHQGLRFEPRAIFNLSEPDMSRNWFPCYDEPWDKATSEMIATVPDTLFCASNGLLLSETDNLDGTRTFHWRTDYQSSTYLISVAISNYMMFSHWFHYTPTDSMEMPYYVYPEKFADAQASFAAAPAMMEFFSETFGLYPFIDEKYGTAHAEVGGAMENLTCTTYGWMFSNGGNWYDWIIAHELAHSWFGNSVTLGDWEDIWLNEGFATYGDALWREHLGGEGWLNIRLEQFKTDYFSEDASNRFPIYDPVNMWGATVYQKGAWILHMLRYMTGDGFFFDAVRAYYNTYAYDNATTEDLRAIFQSVSGMDLTVFFSEWVYQAGYPEYQYHWTAYNDGSDYWLRFHLAQVQIDAPVFTIPVELLVSTASGDSLVRLLVGGAEETYLLAFNEVPMGVIFDPGNDILKTAEEVTTGVRTADTTPGIVANPGNYPNPFNPSTVITFATGAPASVSIEIYNVCGSRVQTIEAGWLPAGEHEVVFNGRDVDGNNLPSGTYFLLVRAGNTSITHKITLLK